MSRTVVHRGELRDVESPACYPGGEPTAELRVCVGSVRTGWWLHSKPPRADEGLITPLYCSLPSGPPETIPGPSGVTQSLSY